MLKKGGAFIFGFPIKNRITRILFKLIGRDDRQIHPQNHASILAALKRYFEVLRQEVFPGGLLGGVGLYLAGKAISLKGRDVP